MMNANYNTIEDELLTAAKMGNEKDSLTNYILRKQYSYSQVLG